MFLLYHPDLIPFICWELWLPTIIDIRDLNKAEKTKFDSLTVDQKFKFMCISEVLSDYIAKWWNYWERIKQDSAENIMNKYYKYAEIYTDSMTYDLNERIKEKTTKGYVILAWVLREEYGLTRQESEKVAKYLEEIADPEMTEKLREGTIMPSTWALSLSATPALLGKWKWWRVLIFALVAAVALWVGWTLYVQNVWKRKPTEVKVYWDHTEIVDFEKVFEIVSAYAKTDSNTRRFDEPGFWNFDEDTWTWIERQAKKVWNVFIDGANAVQSRSLELQLTTEIWYHFDMKWVRWEIERDKDGKWIFYIYLNEPELRIDKEEAQILNSKREWFNMDKFDDYELKCVRELEHEALEAANNPEDIQRAKDHLKENLLSLFRLTWYADSNMVVKGEDVKDVVLIFNLDMPPLR